MLTSPKRVVPIIIPHLFPLEFGLCDNVKMDAPTNTSFYSHAACVCLLCPNAASQGYFCLFTCGGKCKGQVLVVVVVIVAELVVVGSRAPN